MVHVLFVVLELLTYHRFSSKPFGLFLDIKFFFVSFKIDLVKFYHKIFAELLTVPNENDYFKDLSMSKVIQNSIFLISGKLWALKERF